MSGFTLEPPFLLARFHDAIGSERIGEHFLIGASPAGITTLNGEDDDQDSDHVAFSIQGEGVKLYNITDQKCVNSWTAPPSIIFAQPAIHCPARNDDDAHYTYALIASGPQVPKDEENRVVWLWKDLKKGQADESLTANRSTKKFDGRIQALHISEAIPTHVIVVEEQGSVLLVSRDLDRIAAKQKEQCSGEVIWSSLFVTSNAYVRSCCVPNTVLPMLSTVVVTISHADNSDIYTLRLHHVSQTLKHVSVLAKVDIQLQAKPISFTFNPIDGRVTALDNAGTWTIWSLDLKLGASRKVTAHLTECLSRQMSGYSFYDESIGSTASIASLSDGYVAMVAPRATKATGHPQHVVSVWDVKYGTLQASYPLTAAEQGSAKKCVCRIAALPNSHLSLTVSHFETKTAKSGKKTKASVNVASLVLLFPYDSEPMSLMAATGKMKDTVEFLGISGRALNDKAHIGVTRSDTTVITHDVPMNDHSGDVYNAWIHGEKRDQEAEDEVLAALQSSDITKEKLTAIFMKHVGIESADVDMEDAEPVSVESCLETYTKMLDGYSSARITELSNLFVSTVTAKCFAEKGDNPDMSLWCVEPILFLMHIGALRNSCIQGGLVQALLERKQLAVLLIALKKVPDIPEADMVTLIQELIHLYPEPSARTDRFPQFLLRTIDTDWSEVSMQQSLKRLSPSELAAVLHALLLWLEKENTDLAAVPTAELKKLAEFANVILNIHFDTIIMEPSVYETMAKLRQEIVKLNAWFDSLDQLRSMLRFFTREPSAKKVQNVLPMFAVETFKWSSTHPPSA